VTAKPLRWSPLESRESALVWDGAPKRLVDTTRPETLARFREAYPGKDGETRAYLAAAVAASGDAEALEALRKDLRDEDSATRKFAIQALARVGLAREAAGLLSDDKDETVPILLVQIRDDMNVGRAVDLMPNGPNVTHAELPENQEVVLQTPWELRVEGGVITAALDEEHAKATYGKGG